MDFLLSAKRFLREHVFIVVMAAAFMTALLNYMIFPVIVSGRMNLISIPVAAEDAAAGTYVTDGMVTEILIPEDSVPDGVITEKAGITGKYVSEGAFIPEGGFFTSGAVSGRAESLGSVFTLLETGEWAYTFSVPERYCKDDRLKTGQHTDIYFLGETEKQDEVNENMTYRTHIFGLLAEDVRIISTDGDGDSSCLLTVAIPEGDISYFALAERLGEIFPLMSYESAETDDFTGSEVYGADNLRAWIDSETVTVRLERATETDLLDG